MELWHLHFQADVQIVETTSEMTRAQKIVLRRLDSYWSEKARQKGQSESQSFGGASTPSF